MDLDRSHNNRPSFYFFFRSTVWDISSFPNDGIPEKKGMPVLPDGYCIFKNCNRAGRMTGQQMAQLTGMYALRTC